VNGIHINNQLTTDLGYYWREYTGGIPVDAIVGGKDYNGKHIFIGQAYIRNKGLVVVQITPGVRQVFAPIYGVKKIDKYVKVTKYLLLGWSAP
jgi:hypothetical protein